MGSERYVLCMLCHPGNGAGLSGYGSKEGHGGVGGVIFVRGEVAPPPTYLLTLQMFKYLSMMSLGGKENMSPRKLLT